MFENKKIEYSMWIRDVILRDVSRLPQSRQAVRSQSVTSLLAVQLTSVRRSSRSISILTRVPRLFRLTGAVLSVTDSQYHPTQDKIMGE